MSAQIQGFETTPQQKRIWLLQQNSQMYHAQCALLIEGPLQQEQLQLALQHVIRRHEILRTAFPRVPGMRAPLQSITAEHMPQWRTSKLSRANADKLVLRIKEMLRHERQQPFDFEGAPLVRAALFELADKQHLLMLTLPTLCADAGTLQNLASEIAVGYAQQPHAIADDDIVQYVQFSEWQNELLQDEESQDGQAYWAEQLAKPAAVQLPYEKIGSSHASDTEIYTLDLVPELSSDLQVAARRAGISDEALLLSAWQILLARLSQQEHIVVQVMLDGRKFEDLNATCGLLAKVLPIGSAVRANLQCSEMLRQTQQALEAARDQQEYFTPDQNLEDDQQPNAYGIGFEYVAYMPRYKHDQLTISVYRQYVCNERLKLKLSCATNSDGGLIGEIHYDPRVFNSAAIACLSEQLVTLLIGMVQHPESLIDELPLLNDQQRHQLLTVFNDTAAAYPSDRCFHHLFEEQVARSPEARAVVFGTQQLTYTELNRRANQLAASLRTQGLGPDTLVAVCLERSLELMVALLAIFKAGGAYVPLNPDYPAERLAFLLADTAAPLLITQRHLTDRLPEQNTAQVVYLDDETSLADEDQPNVDGGAQPGHLAYVLYTSGSTGQPKGVMVPHQGLVNYLSWCINTYPVVAGQGAAVHSPIAFDLTITTLFAPLLVGRTVVLLPEDEGIEGLSQLLNDHPDFSLIKLTPSHLELLSRRLATAQLATSTRALVIGGEALSGSNLGFWTNNAPSIRLFNEYGPTETVVGCCVYEVPVGTIVKGPVPIGQPISNVQIYLLDAAMEPVAIGVPGELYIGGDSLARGYLNQPALSAEKFVPHPYSAAAGARLYRTGDLARFRPDGQLEFLKRLDQQIKLRGFRIELGEIEAALLEHPQVAEAVVVLLGTEPNETRLVAYVVLRSDAAVTVNDLRSFLKQKLPEYMVPSAFMLLPHLPLTTNGKVDRQALPAPQGERPELESTYVAPRDDLEQVLTNVWQEHLRITKLGIHDNVFDMGAHSLLVAQVHIHLGELLDTDISMLDLLQYPTVSTLAERMRRNQPESPALQQSTSRAQSRKEAIKRSRRSTAHNRQDDETRQ